MASTIRQIDGTLYKAIIRYDDDFFIREYKTYFSSKSSRAGFLINDKVVYVMIYDSKYYIEQRMGKCWK